MPLRLTLLFICLTVANLPAATYVTEEKVAIDRCASAWFIKRFVDSDATFAFFPQGQTPPAGIGFGFYGATYFNKGRDCTFTALVRAFNKGDVLALRQMNDLANDVVAWRQGPNSLATRLRIGIDEVHDAVRDDDKTLATLLPAFDLLFYRLGGDQRKMQPAALKTFEELPKTLLKTLSIPPAQTSVSQAIEVIRQNANLDPQSTRPLQSLYLLIWDKTSPASQSGT